MKTQFYKTIKVFALVLLTACNTIYDNMPPCKVYFNFVYDKNMLYADAFHSQCDNVELFIFNQDSTFIKSATVSGDLLKQLDYKMEVPIEVGNYIAFAWVGIENSYKLSELKPGVSKIDDLKLKLKTESNHIQRKKIESLWHAEPITFSFNGERNICNTLELTRNTNTIRIGIKTINADDNIEKRSYNVKIIADNSTYDYTNRIIKSETTHYLPYFTNYQNDMFITELNTLRFIDSESVRLVVETTDGKSFFGDKGSIDLIEYLLMSKMDKYSTMPNQEYLDREYDWDIVLFYNNQNSLAIQIIINDWVIRFNETDFN